MLLSQVGEKQAGWTMMTMVGGERWRREVGDLRASVAVLLHLGAEQGNDVVESFSGL